MQSQNTTVTSPVRYVRSSRNPNEFYTVALSPRGYWECSCPAATFRRNVPCKHAKAVAKDGAGLVARLKTAQRDAHTVTVSEAGRDFVDALQV
jgi:hypothetical protein